MNINNFVDRYGIDTTNNFQLRDWAKQLKIKPFYYCMRDEILPTLSNLDSYYAIVNIHNSNQKGIHHSAVYKNEKGNPIYFFDSYGNPPSDEIINLIDHEFSSCVTYSTFKIQKPNEKWCGQLSIWFLYQLSLGVQYENIVLDLYDYVL